MFTNPIKHTRLRGMDQLLKFSVKTNFCSEQRNIFCLLDGQFAFTDDFGYIHVTPFRSEIPIILIAAGYEAGTLLIPCVSDTDENEFYGWLKTIADEENLADTYEMAFQLSSKKGIKSVKLNYQKLHIKEILYSYDDVPNRIKYNRMVEMFLLNDTQDNIATYIVVDEKRVLICDEYGRTFLVTAKTVINDVVNAIIDAGYTRTTHPEKYVRTIRLPSDI